MYNALSDAVRQADVDDSVRVVLFQGDGDSFTAGNDMADFARQAGADNSAESPVHRFIGAISNASKPLVAAVQGNAVGIGTTMLLHCDLVYLADNARLITPFVKLALVPEAASSWLLPLRIGHVRAYAMFALGEPMEAAAALLAAWRMPWCRRVNFARRRVTQRSHCRDCPAARLAKPRD